MFADDSITTIAIIVLAYGVAGLLKGALGLGFTTACLPILVLALGHKESLALVIIPSILSNIMLMREAGQYKATAKAFWPLYVAVVPGVIGGVMLLNALDAAIPTIVLGAVMLAYCLFSLVRPQFRLSDATARRLLVPMGVVNGLVNGFTGSQVMPMVPFLMATSIEAPKFVQAVNMVFTISSVVMFFGLSQAGLFSLEEFWVSVVGAGIVYVGVAVGTRVRSRLSEATYRQAVLIFLAGLGASLIVRTVW